TAAVMQNVDLVISADTATAHLAGALGVPVWVALSTVPDWRWLLEREDSPWYPSMRLFRQSELDNWRPVFERMAEEVKNLLMMRVPAEPKKTTTAPVKQEADNTAARFPRPSPSQPR